jgi:hypothetical protein
VKDEEKKEEKKRKKKMKRGDASRKKKRSYCFFFFLAKGQETGVVKGEAKDLRAFWSSGKVNCFFFFRFKYIVSLWSLLIKCY